MEVNSTMKNLILILALSLFSSVSFAQKLRLALNWKPEAQFGGFYAAQKFFDQEKIPVDIKIGGSGTPTVQMLTSGQTEYAIVSADEIILSHDRGAKDIVALFASFQTNPQMIMAHESQNYGSLKDLMNDPKGTLLWQSGLPYAQFLAKKYKPLKVKTAPYSGGIGSFQADPKISQQGFITSEPLTAKSAGLKIKAFLVADEGYNPYTTVLVTQKSRLKSHPEEVKKMVAAVTAGWKSYLKDPLPTNELMKKLNSSQSIETLKDSAAAQLLLVAPASSKPGQAALEVGSMTEARWSELINQLHDLKIIKTKPAPTDLFHRF